MNKCLKCSYEWEALKEEPKQCPACKNYRWNQPPRPSGKPRTSPPKEPLQKPQNSPIIADNPKEVSITDTSKEAPKLSFLERLRLKRERELNSTGGIIK